MRPVECLSFDLLDGFLVLFGLSQSSFGSLFVTKVGVGSFAMSLFSDVVSWK